MTSRRNLVWLIPLGLFLSFPLWQGPAATFLTPRGDYTISPTPSPDEQEATGHNFTMDKVHIIQSSNGRVSVEIIADQAKTGDNPEDFELKEVDAVITGKDNEQTYVTAREGRFSQETSLLTLIDEVVVIKPKDKYELYTDLLHYDGKNKMVNCPGKTRLIGEKIKISGGSLDYDMLTNAYDIGGRVYCELSGVSAR